MENTINYKEDLKNRLPDLKAIEGFPLGNDEDIIELSDPPYYTACPNPYINEFIEIYGKPYNEETDDYHREPFVGDVSEGKNDPIYNAHSYHTKVPHKAIMKYIEHYTDEGDIVLDGFCGTGMTGVAAQLLNRKAILSDLSPIATFIAYNYNNPVDLLEFKLEAKRILDEVEKECGWMYETTHYINGKPVPTKGKINYVVWSDVLICPICKKEYVYWNASLDYEVSKVLDDYSCPNCKAIINKADSQKAKRQLFDVSLNQNIEILKQVPVLIKYTFNKKSYEKKPDDFDYNLINKLDLLENAYWFPIDRMPIGDEARRNDKYGLTHVHHFYTRRILYILSTLNNKLNRKTLIILTSILERASKRVMTVMSNYFAQNKGKTLGGWAGKPMVGTLYLPSISTETSVLISLDSRIKSIIKLNEFKSKYKTKDSYRMSTNSTTQLPAPDNSIDYIFTDPPFGANIMYSELSYFWESWLRIKTNNKSEAIINNSQKKDLSEYLKLMLLGFQEYYRILKPNRWITVEFHNSKSSVWNVIQEAMTKAGFIIAQVTVLDKQQSSFKQYAAPGTVKNDLVISAYKPSKNFDERIMKNAGKDFEIEFVHDFLSNLPKRPMIERTEQMLYSKMLAYYVQRGYEVQYNSTTFYTMLRNHFVEEDGLWFNDNQIAAYRIFKQQMKLEGKQDGSQGMLTLFVTDEKSAIIWLTNFLSEPKSFSDVHSAFTKLLNKQDDIMPELSEILQENFILDNDKYRKSNSEEEHKALGEKRQRLLLKQFETLLLEAQKSKKKIKTVRKEALTYGMETYHKNRRFKEIIELGKKLDSTIIDNNAEISMFIETAQLEIEGLGE